MCCFAKNKGIEDLKMHYQYTVIEFVCSSSTGTRIPEECVTGIPVIQFVCSWSTGRKEIIVKFEKKETLLLFAILYIKYESLGISDIFE